MTNPFPFTSGNILSASELNAIGAWTAFTPTWGSVTLGGSGTTNGVYAQVNDIVFWEAQFDLNGTGSITGQINMNLPVGTSPRSITSPTAMSGWARPTGGSIYDVSGFTSATECFFYGLFSSGASGWSTLTALNATQPATWNVNGNLSVSGWYELT